eukprot:5393325-Amphidinium_carterae.1
MRWPTRVLSHLPRSRPVGAQVAWEFIQFCAAYPSALEVGVHVGDPEHARARADIVLAWRRHLRRILQAADEAHPHPLLGPPSPLQGALLGEGFKPRATLKHTSSRPGFMRASLLGRASYMAKD